MCIYLFMVLCYVFMTRTVEQDTGNPVSGACALCLQILFAIILFAIMEVQRMWANTPTVAPTVEPTVLVCSCMWRQTARVLLPRVSFPHDYTQSLEKRSTPEFLRQLFPQHKPLEWVQSEGVCKTSLVAQQLLGSLVACSVSACRLCFLRLCF